MIIDAKPCVSLADATTNNLHKNNSCEKFTSNSPKLPKSSDSEQSRTKSEACSSGFIHSSTSDTRSYFWVDKYLSRAKKMKCGVITSARLHDEEIRYKRAVIDGNPYF